MKTFIVLATFLLLAVIEMSSVRAEVCAGCISDADAKDPKYKEMVKKVLATVGNNSGVLEVISVRKQVVAGLKYYMKVRLDDGNVCDISYVEQPWISPEPQAVTFDCPRQ